jgi:hypothetical protein
MTLSYDQHDTVRALLYDMSGISCCCKIDRKLSTVITGLHIYNLQSLKKGKGAFLLLSHVMRLVVVLKYDQESLEKRSTAKQQW